MFMSKNYTPEQNSHNIIASGTVITGDINCTADIRIDGSIDGNLKSNGHVILGDAGKFSGTMVSKDVDIWGSFEGTLTATDTLTIRNTGKVKADIAVGTLIIEQGAELNGSCKMGKELPKPQQAAEDKGTAKNNQNKK